jgi:ergothioneine biosynthesis protein EgtB
MEPANQAAEKPQRQLERLADARSRTDRLFAIVRPDAIYDRPIPERHRILFYIGHLEAFDWNLLGRQLFQLDSAQPDYDRLFAFGIDPVDGGLPADQPSDWPGRAEVERYNRRLRDRLDRQLERVSWSDPDQPLLRDGVILNVAIEHRLMHAETLAYMLHQLPPEKKMAPPTAPERRAPTAAPRMIEVPAGTATLGLERSAGIFGWDNEFEAHAVPLPAFSIDQYKVTNGQFLEFLNAGGYQNRALWSEADWNWKRQEKIQHPSFWIQRDGEWRQRTMFGEVTLPADWPVYVSHAETMAYARWKGLSLPSEAQWQRAAYGSAGGGEREYPWGSSAPAPGYGNFDFERWDPTPVSGHPQGDSAFGISDLVGNGWEWTSTPFGPFPRFEPFPFYPGYSANFFDGQHFVMKGGSARTAACMLRRSFRNWFQPRYPYVYAGFRCVQAESSQIAR